MQNGTTLAIEAKGLTKIYGQRQIALHSVELAIAPGSIIGILGRNGAGKTTLIRLLLGLQRPTAGKVIVLGKPMTPNAARLRRRMGYVSADPKFPPGMTTLGYLDFVGKLQAIPFTERRNRLAALLDAVDLLRQSGDPVGQLSTGMKARLAIAASLINDPEILIWDEPAQGLDPEGRRGLLQLVRSLAESKTLLLCSHFLADIETVCERSVVLHEGRLLFDGELANLRKKSGPAAVELTCTGDKREILEAFKAIQKDSELAGATLNRNVMALRIKPGASSATVLANALVTLSDHKLELANLRICGEATEQAILQLLNHEASRGLTRAHPTRNAA